MALHVWDHIARAKRKFEPIRPGQVGMYVCGMTVQDKPHVGHMFAFVACDMVRRYLEYLGYQVTHVQNFTDIDDKIIVKAQAEGVDYRVVADRNIAAFHAAAAQLRLQPAHHYPLATAHIDGIIAFTEKLIDQGYAYAVDGDVYFDVRSFPDYGRLSGRHVDDMRSGIRIEVGEKKRDPLDFALWKAAKSGEPAWDSPWGAGRPGWHIECSVMSIGLLGEHFDFHGGGQDLLFPHHENERAQSCACTGHAFVNFWLHNGLLYLGDKKMSKSDGNFFAMADVLAKIRPEVLRFFLLNAHFRSQIDYSEERLQESAAALERLTRGVGRLVEALNSDVVPVPEGLISAPGETLAKAVRDARRRFFAAMDDDFNSGGALGVLFGLVRDLNQYFATAGEKVLDRGVLEEARHLLTEADTILVLLPGGVEGCAAQADAVPAEILALVAERVAARKAREWARADALRATLIEKGWLVEDSAAGSTVRRGG